MTRPFWLPSLDYVYPSLSTDIVCDIVIVGGGICGASTAWHLRNAGLRVVLVEERGISHSATGRNAGFILQGTAERYNRAVSLMGREKARQIHGFSLENHIGIREWTEQHPHLDCEYKQSGSLQLASSQEEEDELVESADLLLEDGFSAELLYGAELGQTYVDAGFHTGIVLPEDGEIHPAKFIQHVVHQSNVAGLQVFENTSVTHIEYGAQPVVHTKHGTIRSEMVIVCTNARVGTLLGQYKDIVSPVRGQMLATAPAPKIFDRPIYADHGFDYWRQTPQGNIVLGGWRNLDPSTEVGFDETLHPEIQQHMEDFLHKFSALHDVEIIQRWSGIMGFSKDGLPLVGPVPGLSNILVGAGFTGHGFGFAWLAGKALADVTTEGSHPFADVCTPNRFA